MPASLLSSISPSPEFKGIKTRSCGFMAFRVGISPSPEFKGIKTVSRWRLSALLAVFPQALNSKGLRQSPQHQPTSVCISPSPEFKGIKTAFCSFDNPAIAVFPQALNSKGLRHLLVPWAPCHYAVFPQALNSKGLRQQFKINTRFLTCISPSPEFKGIKTSSPSCSILLFVYFPKPWIQRD